MAGFYSREYSYKQRLVSWLSQNTNFTYTCRRGVARGLKRKGGLSFLPSLAQPTAEETFLRGLDLRGKIIFDVGGFMGMMTLLFASRGKRVFTFEPNPEARQRIRENLTANGFDSVTLREVAVGGQPGKVELVFDALMAGGASGDAKVSAELRATAARPRIIQAEVTTLDREIAAGLPVPDLVKIDVEGMECAVLQGMRNLLATRKPWVYVELHGTDSADKQAKASGAINALREFGYRLYDVERASYIAPDDPVTGKESHIFGD
jgi:FkbM family methyltransferase